VVNTISIGVIISSYYPILHFFISRFNRDSTTRYKKGKKAKHKISIIESEDAKELIDFSEILPKICYEFSSIVNKKYFEKKPNNRQIKQS